MAISDTPIIVIARKGEIMNIKQFVMLVISSCLISIFVFGNVLFAETTSYDYDIVWNASTMPTGTFSGDNGLESVGKGDLEVTESSRYYENVRYEKTIKTNGYTTINSNYVPSKRALKFTISQPCYMDLLAFGTSSDLLEVPIYVSRSGTLVSTFDLMHNDLSSNTVYLDKADTYYIYCLTGSVGISYIHLYYKKGDINADNTVDKDDLTMLYQILYDSEDFDSETLSHADLDANGSINENDITQLTNIIRKSGGYIPKYYSEKTWTMDNYETGTVYSSETDVDGLVIVPKPNGSSGKDLYITEGETKIYKEYSYNKYLATNGAAKLNHDYTVGSRGVKIYAKEPCYMTILVRCASTNSDVDPCLTISAKDSILYKRELTGSGDLDKTELQYIQVKLNEPNEYSICDTTGAINIYQIILSKTSTTFLTESDNDTVWSFDDEAFDKYTGQGHYVFSENTTINGLTFLPQSILNYKTGTNHVKGERVYNYALLSKTTSYMQKGSISFNVNSGTTDIYVFAQTANKNYFRQLAISSNQSTKDTQIQYIKDIDCYHYTYTGNSGKIYIYAPGDNVKVYRVCIKRRNNSYYNELPDERIWDFSDKDIRGDLYKRTYYNGLNIFATESKPVKVDYNSVKTNEGFQYYYALSLPGDGCNSYRSIAFDVAPSSYVYITARVPAEGETRQLTVTNKYCADIQTDLKNSYIDVDDSIKVYRFRYNGIGEKIYLRSADSQIRIYQIAVKKITRNNTSDSIFNFSDMQVGDKITDFSSDNLNISSPYSSSTIVSDPIDGYENALSLYTNESFSKAGKVYFRMSNGNYDFSGTPRLISIIAKGKEEKLHIANKYGYIYKSFDLTENPQLYTYKYDDPEEYLYLYGNGNEGKSGSIKIYNIMTNDTDYRDTSNSNIYPVSFKVGDDVSVYLTGESIPALDRYNYSVTYNSDLLHNPNITWGPDISNGSVKPSVEYKDGEIIFSIDDSSKQNWSGIFAVLSFRAWEDGSDKIKINVYKKGGEL